MSSGQGWLVKPKTNELGAPSEFYMGSRGRSSWQLAKPRFSTEPWEVQKNTGAPMSLPIIGGQAQIGLSNGPDLLSTKFVKESPSSP